MDLLRLTALLELMLTKSIFRRALEARAEAEGRLRQANEERGQVDRLLANYTQQKKQAEVRVVTRMSTVKLY